MDYKPVLNPAQSFENHPDYGAPVGAYVTDALVDFTGCFIYAHPREFKIFMAAGLVLMGFCVGVDALKDAESPKLGVEKAPVDNTDFGETEN